MANTRITARLDIKGSNHINGIHLEGLRVMGDPQLLNAGADKADINTAAIKILCSLKKYLKDSVTIYGPLN